MLDLNSLEAILRDDAGPVVDADVLGYVVESIARDLAPIENDPDAWKKLSMLWPPRLVGAYRDRRLIPFFGSGVSVAAGLPSWHTLLVENFGLSSEFVDDKELAHDPLTLAELAAQHVGADALQNTLHEIYESAIQPTTTHALLCCLRCPIYVTTNYDILFERAWERVNPGIVLQVVTNDLWIDRLQRNVEEFRSSTDQALLIKVHGSADRRDEQLILTRRDYRHHYRSNGKLFSILRGLLSRDHVLFLGFSHRDPEVSRLVDDAIFQYERIDQRAHSAPPERPHFYSLQFNMMAHSPEVYAARGLVALRPPVLRRPTKDSRSAALSLALAELMMAGEKDTHSKIQLDQLLTSYADRLAQPLGRALAALGRCETEALARLHDSTTSSGWMDELLQRLKSSASQGVWLLNDAGQVVEFRVPEGQDPSARQSTLSLSRRPYFRHAKTYRKPFVSDTAQSVFNRNSTFFICHPLMRGPSFAGLLFSACQTGSWRAPAKMARDCSRRGLLFVLVDSNGVVLVPPKDEFRPSGNSGPQGADEEKSKNLGYPYGELLSLSRRDFLVSQVARNIVPVAQDDDIATVSADLRIYSAITKVRHTDWKLCLARTIVQSVPPA